MPADKINLREAGFGWNWKGAAYMSCFRFYLYFSLLKCFSIYDCECNLERERMTWVGCNEYVKQ